MKLIKTSLLFLLTFVSMLLFAKDNNAFTLNSSGVKADGSLMIKYSGEGVGISMPLAWKNAPKGTQYFALNLWHLPHPEDSREVKSYWVLYNIPANISQLTENNQTIGTFGYNDKEQRAYDPMKSKGPGVKEYHITLYALSEALAFDNKQVYRNDLLNAMKGKVLGKCTLSYTYETDKHAMQGQDLGGNPREGEERTEELTESQKAKITAILANYDASNLSVEDAKAIQEAFREAGLRGGPSAEETIRKAGFDPEQLRELAPPPSNGQETQALHDECFDQ